MSLSISEKRTIFRSLIFPLFFLAICWLIKFGEIVFEINLTMLGVYPHKLKGLPGILFSPLIHKDFQHIIANTVPLLTLSIGLFYFYDKIAYKVFFLIYIITGIWVWFGAREAYHIGASGLVYGLASFLFVSGVIRNNIRLISISLLVVFLYGGMIWGVLPIQKDVSWESHLLGSVSGIVLAVIYRKEGPETITFEWEKENNDNDAEDNTNNIVCTYKNCDINYQYKKNNKEDDL